MKFQNVSLSTGNIFTKGFCKYLSNCTSTWTVFIGFPILPDTLYIFLCLARFPARYLPFFKRFSPETWFLTKFRRGNFQNTHTGSIYSHNALIFHCGIIGLGHLNSNMNFMKRRTVRRWLMIRRCINGAKVTDMDTNMPCSRSLKLLRRWGKECFSYVLCYIVCMLLCRMLSC